MLMLLKPWRDLSTDLKGEDESWEEAFNRFIQTNQNRFSRILSNVQYYHQCQSAAAKAQEEGAEGVERYQEGVEMEEANEFDLGEGFLDESEGLTEEGLQDAIDSQISVKEYMHGHFAVEIAKHMHIFSDGDTAWDLKSAPPAIATGGDIQLLHAWKEQMRGDVRRMNDERATTVDDDIGEVYRIDDVQAGEGSHTGGVTPLTPKESIKPMEPSKLKEDQRRAYEIITWHLRQTMGGRTHRLSE